MIYERWRWMLKDITWCFDGLPNAEGRFPCRLCRAQNKGEVTVPQRDLERHLAAHRREKILREERQDLTELLA